MFLWISWDFVDLPEFHGCGMALISETLTRGILIFYTKGIKIKNVGPWKQTSENFISFAL